MEISGLTIRAYRQRLGMSQRDFAETLGVSQGVISLMELGRCSVSRKMLKRLRIRSDEDALSLTFSEFLSESGVPLSTEAEFNLVRPISLELWQSRINLLKPADGGVPGRFYVPGVSEGTRAFMFVPAPLLLGENTIAAFRPASFSDLVRNQIIIVQFKPGAAPDGLPVALSHLGRSIVVRRGGTMHCQFEPESSTSLIVNLDETAVDVLMICFFQGCYSQRLE